MVVGGWLAGQTVLGSLHLKCCIMLIRYSKGSNTEALPKVVQKACGKGAAIAALT